MKSIYIVFFATDLKVGKFIRLMTRNHYNHVSISMNGLSTFYSYSRLYMNHPSVGGFVEESPNRYLMSNKTDVKGIKIEVDDCTYDMIEQYINGILARPELYVYNYLSAAGYIIGRRIFRNNAYTCVEFVRDLLVYAGVLSENGSSCVKIRELENELQSYDCVEGSATELLSRNDWGNDCYLDHVGRIAATREACRRFGKLIHNT